MAQQILQTIISKVAPLRPKPTTFSTRQLDTIAHIFDSLLSFLLTEQTTTAICFAILFVPFYLAPLSLPQFIR